MLNFFPKNDLPNGPKGKFISGNYFDFFRNQLDFLTDCSKKFDDDVVYLRFFHLPIYLVNHPDLVEEVFAKKSADFRKAKTLRTPLQKMLFGNSILTGEGEFWLRQRRAIQPAFHQSFLAEYAKIIVETTQEFIGGWKEGEKRSVSEDLVDLTFKIASRAFFGIEGDAQKHIIRELVDANKSIFSVQNRFNWFADNFLPTPKNIRFRKAVKKVNKLISDLIQDRKSEKHEKRDLLSVLLSIKNGETEQLTEKQLRDEIITIFIAGHETTAVTLSWVWVLLSQNPQASAKFQNEIQTVLGDRTVGFSDLSKLEFTSQILKESLRMYPPNRSTAREAIRDCQIGTHKIPAGAQIVLPQWVVHRDERFFDSPGEFLPERWTKDFERDLHKYAYFPFGGGARMCIGRSFAMMETTLILSTIAQKFQISLDSSENIEPVPVILLRPKGELKTTLKSSS
jgi:cytochrome P450